MIAAPIPPSRLAGEPRLALPAAPSPEAAGAERPMMGGRVAVHIIDDQPAWDREAAAGRVLDRLATWAGRLTRFEPDSELSRLNDAPGREIAIGPTLTTVLDWAREVEGLTDGLVSVAMLDARLGAERGEQVSRPGAASRRWSLRRRARGAIVERGARVRFDLDGVAKGWLADRALAITRGRTALVDGDGDIAIRVAAGDELGIGIADPRQPDTLLGALRLAGDGRGIQLGLATSGTTVHRWARGNAVAHHVIDPRTWRPAATDVVQATVLAASAAAAEAFAKVAVIAGAERAFQRLDRPDVLGILLVTDRGEVRASPGMIGWLA